MKPRFRYSQITPNCDRGNGQHLRNFIHRKPAEVAKLYHFAFARIELLQSIEARVKSQQDLTLLKREPESLLKWHVQSRPLAGVSSSRVVNQDLTHEPGRNAIEMRPIFPGRIALFHQPKVRLV